MHYRGAALGVLVTDPREHLHNVSPEAPQSARLAAYLLMSITSCIGTGCLPDGHDRPLLLTSITIGRHDALPAKSGLIAVRY